MYLSIRTVRRYLINNANFESYIKIVKKDAETGNTIPYAGAGFQIYDPNGELVTMTFTYPEVTTIDTFYTTADGDLSAGGRSAGFPAPWIPALLPPEAADPEKAPPQAGIRQG